MSPTPKKKRAHSKTDAGTPTVDYSRVGVTVEQPAVFRYDPEPARRVVRAFETASSEYRKLRQKMSVARHDLFA